jgi:hypothetical protein
MNASRKRTCYTAKNGAPVAMLLKTDRPEQYFAAHIVPGC